MAADSRVNTSSASPPSYPKVWFARGYEATRLWGVRGSGRETGRGFVAARSKTTDRSGGGGGGVGGGVGLDGSRPVSPVGRGRL